MTEEKTSLQDPPTEDEPTTEEDEPTTEEDSDPVSEHKTFNKDMKDGEIDDPENFEDLSKIGDKNIKDAAEKIKESPKTPIIDLEKHVMEGSDKISDKLGTKLKSTEKFLIEDKNLNIVLELPDKKQDKFVEDINRNLKEKTINLQEDIKDTEDDQKSKTIKELNDKILTIDERMKILMEDPIMDEKEKLELAKKTMESSRDAIKKITEIDPEANISIGFKNLSRIRINKVFTRIDITLKEKLALFGFYEQNVGLKAPDKRNLVNLRKNPDIFFESKYLWAYYHISNSLKEKSYSEDFIKKFQYNIFRNIKWVLTKRSRNVNLKKVSDSNITNYIRFLMHKHQYIHFASEAVIELGKNLKTILLDKSLISPKIREEFIKDMEIFKKFKDPEASIKYGKQMMARFNLFDANKLNLTKIKSDINLKKKYEEQVVIFKITFKNAFIISTEKIKDIYERNFSKLYFIKEDIELNEIEKDFVELSQKQYSNEFDISLMLRTMNKKIKELKSIKSEEIKKKKEILDIKKKAIEPVIPEIMKETKEPKSLLRELYVEKPRVKKIKKKRDIGIIPIKEKTQEDLDIEEGIRKSLEDQQLEKYLTGLSEVPLDVKKGDIFIKATKKLSKEELDFAEGIRQSLIAKKKLTKEIAKKKYLKKKAKLHSEEKLGIQKIFEDDPKKSKKKKKII